MFIGKYRAAVFIYLTIRVIYVDLVTLRRIPGDCNKFDIVYICRAVEVAAVLIPDHVGHTMESLAAFYPFRFKGRNAVHPFKRIAERPAFVAVICREFIHILVI